MDVGGADRHAGWDRHAAGQNCGGVWRRAERLSADQIKLFDETCAADIAAIEKEIEKLPHGSAIAKAIDYSVNRWEALTRFLGDGDIPIDNNWNENRIRPIAQGRSAWLFAGSLRAGKRGAAIMSLIQPAKLNGHDPYAYLKDVLTRLPTQPTSRIEELLPHLWQNSATR